MYKEGVDISVFGTFGMRILGNCFLGFVDFQFAAVGWFGWWLVGGYLRDLRAKVLAMDWGRSANFGWAGIILVVVGAVALGRRSWVGSVMAGKTSASAEAGRCRPV